MNLPLFIFVATGVFLCPLLPPFIAACRFKPEQSIEKSIFLQYWLAEIMVIGLVFVSFFLLGQMAPHNGLIDPDIFSSGGDAAKWQPLWEAVRYGLAAFGVLLGAFLLKRGLKLIKDKSTLSGLLVSFGCISLVYGLVVPMFMDGLVGTIRDSHLIG